MANEKNTMKDYRTSVTAPLCPQCGDWMMITALQKALIQTGCRPENTVVVFDIGCMGNVASSFGSYVFHSLHGRALPTAFGVYMANHDLNVIVVTGDGGLYSEGGNHLLHLARYNPNITVLVANNRLFSLTTGQASPTTPMGQKTQTTQQGEFKKDINPMAVALSSGTSWLGRSFSGDLKHMQETMIGAITHKGFAVLDILQTCPTYNKVQTEAWYKERVFDINKAGYTTMHKEKAFLYGMMDENNSEEKIPIGVFYAEERPLYHEQYAVLQKTILRESHKDSIALENLITQFT